MMCIQVYVQVGRQKGDMLIGGLMAQGTVGFSAHNIQQPRNQQNS